MQTHTHTLWQLILYFGTGEAQKKALKVSVLWENNKGPARIHIHPTPKKIKQHLQHPP